MKKNRARTMLFAAVFAASSFWAQQARAARTDFNGGSFGEPDGKDDVLWLRTDQSSMFIWTILNIYTGEVSTDTHIVGNVPAGWAVGATRDFNGDGRFDIVF